MVNNTVAVGLLLRLEAAPGRENNIQSLPEGGDLDGERGADGHGVVRGPLRSLNVRHLRRLPLRGSCEAHLSGRVAAALMGNVGELFQEPTIGRIDVIASKLPG